MQNLENIKAHSRSPPNWSVPAIFECTTSFHSSSFNEPLAHRQVVHSLASCTSDSRPEDGHLMEFINVCFTNLIWKVLNMRKMIVQCFALYSYKFNNFGEDTSNTNKNVGKSVIFLSGHFKNTTLLLVSYYVVFNI